ncbi:hypothetical protein FRB96_003903 [Tulasnella sp. 330]|nr:hypothetical protein FRB96_003903 [Tulasnella sp. 330]
MRRINPLALLAASLPILVHSAPGILPCFGNSEACTPTPNHPELLALSQSCSGVFTSPSLQFPVGGKLPQDVIYANNIQVEDLFLRLGKHRVSLADLNTESSRMKYVDYVWGEISLSYPDDTKRWKNEVLNSKAGKKASGEFFGHGTLPNRQLVQLHEFLYPHNAPSIPDYRKLTNEELHDLWGDLRDELGQYESPHPRRVLPLSVKRAIVGVAPDHLSKKGLQERPYESWRGFLAFDEKSSDQRQVISYYNINSGYDFVDLPEDDVITETIADQLIQTQLSRSQIEWFYFATYCTGNKVVALPEADLTILRSLPLKQQVKIYQILQWRQDNEHVDVGDVHQTF